MSLSVNSISLGQVKSPSFLQAKMKYAGPHQALGSGKVEVRCGSSEMNGLEAKKGSPRQL